MIAWRPKRTQWALREAKNPDCEKKGPDGRPLCRWCGGRLKGKRRTFCSGGAVVITWNGCVRKPEAWGCVEEWRLRTDGGFFRNAVFARDRGKCAGCGFQCWEETEGDGVLKYPRWTGPRWSERREWHADHRVPLRDGGSGGLENAQTLCDECHKDKTSRENTARAETRRMERCRRRGRSATSKRRSSGGSSSSSPDGTTAAPASCTPSPRIRTHRGS